MHRIALIAVALSGLLGLAALAGADGATYSRAWMFGNCNFEAGDSQVSAASQTAGCRGFGIFIGEFDRESLIQAARAEAEQQTGTPVVLTRLVAIPLGSPFLPAIAASGDDDVCPFPRNTPWASAATPPASGGFGLWVAWFAVEACAETYTFGGDPSPSVLPGGSPHIILGPGWPSYYVTFQLPDGLLFNELTELSADVFVEGADVCEKYTPAF